MVQLTQGINRIRDLHYADATDGIAGTDGTAATASQTGLITPIAASEQNLVKTQGSKTNQFRWKIDSATATGNTFREFEVRNGSDLAFDRSVFPGVAHGTNDELVIIKTYFYKQG